MKAITLTQPWASAVALGYKRVETRSWRTTYRGPIAIHAAKGFPGYAKEFAGLEFAAGRFPDGRLPRGAIVARAVLRDCERTEEAAITISQADARWWGLEHLYGDYAPGRWAWFLSEIEPLAEPVFVRGALGLWEWEP